MPEGNEEGWECDGRDEGQHKTVDAAVITTSKKCRIDERDEGRN
jgi:hypothetical protein